MSLDELAISMTKFFLNIAEKKASTKKSEIIGALRDKGVTNQNYLEVFLRAEKHLTQIFGYSVKEVSVKTSKVLLIVPKDITSHLVVPPEKQPETTLLYLLLTYIFMKGNDVPELSVIKFLDSLQVSLDDENHLYFGNVKKHITETFVKQLYLTRNKIDEEGGTEFIVYYSWGPRSTLELSKKEILDYVSTLLNRPAECFVEQYKEVHGEKSLPNSTQMNKSKRSQR
ncbi:non-structural maintenance of chromosomes element 3 homolog [Phlebotomus papatasi]|uniref:non-structural maintenance of chromosomes element 3 homolog n=1 Tax=Phlebotomus papatasi TaxID=29031 RepID=UPI0024836607|nr:non-structural maintenance of chromosomes element 3 homolog [Phlebotomus papatasi]